MSWILAIAMLAGIVAEPKPVPPDAPDFIFTVGNLVCRYALISEVYDAPGPNWENRARICRMPDGTRVTLQEVNNAVVSLKCR